MVCSHSAGEIENAGARSLLASAEAEAAALRVRVEAMEAEATARAKSCLWWTAAAGLLGALAGSRVSK